MALDLSPESSASSRREFLRTAGGGFGAVALAAMLGHEGVAASPSGTASGAAARNPHFTPRAKRVIYLFMHGGPSHVDLFDPKPDLIRYAGQPLPAEFGSVMTRRKVAENPLLPPVKPLRPRGASGLHVSDYLPESAACADDLCVIRSCHGDSVNHPQSVYQMNTGSILTGKPSLGSWISYGLGTENADMPAFVVMPDPAGGLKGGPPAYGSGYLPASHQGTRSCISSRRHRSPPSAKGTSSTSSLAAIASTSQPAAATTNCRLASALMSWPTACNRLRRSWSTSRTKPRKPNASTVSIARRPRNSVRGACSRGG